MILSGEEKKRYSLSSPSPLVLHVQALSSGAITYKLMSSIRRGP